MAKIICTQAEYDKLSTVLEDNPQFLVDVRVIYDIVEESSTFPKDYAHDIMDVKRMSEYISRDEAINAIKSLESNMPAKDNYAKGYDAALGRVLIAVREVSPVTDVQSVKRGRWVHDGSGYDRRDNWYHCSECNRALNLICGEKLEDYPYCHCGARMEGDSLEK